MGHLTREEKRRAIKNFSWILGIMIIIYSIVYFFWGIYDNALKETYYFPYIKIKSYDFKQAKEFPFVYKGTSVKINKTEYPYLFTIESKNGSSTLKTFDNRFYIYEKPNASIVVYPSYEFRGLEYKVMSNKGINTFVVIPSENLSKNIDLLIEEENFSSIYTADIIHDFEKYLKDNKISFISLNNNFLNITGKNAKFKIDVDTIISYANMQKLLIIRVKEEYFKKKYYIISTDKKITQEVILID